MIVVSFINRAIWKVLPGSLKQWIRHKRFVRKLWSNYDYDVRRFLQHSGVAEGAMSHIALQSRITVDYHRIEKALALRDPRPGFGKAVSERLLTNLDICRQLFGMDTLAQVALNNLVLYDEHMTRTGHADGERRRRIAELQAHANDLPPCRQGGTLKVTRKDIQQAAQHDMSGFFLSRYSVRQFTDEPVSMDLIQKAVALAQSSPSVCNRQSGRVHVFASPDLRLKALQHQDGNLGFREEINVVLAVTSELGSFLTVGERNQCWIDGGIFAMSLVYALHSLGLGTCCLNWSVEGEKDRQLRQAVGIPQSEAIILLVAVGHMPEEFTIAQSPRKPVDEVLTVH